MTTYLEIVETQYGKIFQSFYTVKVISDVFDIQTGLKNRLKAAFNNH